MEIPRKNRAHFKVAGLKVADPVQSSMVGVTKFLARASF
jgi:hypothetical protein